MRTIDLETWARREHYRWYRVHQRPHLALTAELEAGALVAACREEGVGLFAGLLHALTAAANAVPALRQRIRPAAAALPERVVEHERVEPAFTVGLEGERFGFAAVPWRADRAAFAAAVRAESDAVRAADRLTPFDGVRDDLIFLSCLPWVRFTHIEHPTRDDLDCVPRIAWGRVVGRGEGARVPVNIQAHHALVDGIHLGRFFEALQAALAEGGATP